MNRWLILAFLKDRGEQRKSTGALVRPALQRLSFPSHSQFPLRNDTEASDHDILIDPTPETTLFEISAIHHELLQLLRVPVDVLTPKALPAKLRATVHRSY